MRQTRTILVMAATLLALPFWGVLLANWPLRWISQLQPDSTALNTLLAPLSLSGFLSLMALAHPTRYVVLSAMAILAALAALIALVAAHGAQLWRRPAAYLCLAALLAVLVFPWTRAAYQPAIATRPGVALRLVNRPAGLIATAVRSLQIGAEVRPEVYEPLGWADDQHFIYRLRRGAGYDRRGQWQEGEAGPLLAYDVSAGASQAWPGALEDLHARPCPVSACLTPLIEPFYAGSGQAYFPGHYPQVFPSPDDRWRAVVAWHIYGPEDLVIIGNQ